MILRGLSWRVAPGQQWVILGPNGSGKSSLLAALTGYFAPTSGSLSVLGETFGRSDWRELRRRIGLVGPSVAAMIQPAEPSLSVVAGGVDGLINLWRRPKPATLALARRLLRLLKVGGLAARPWGHLSQGERQRVLIARALASSPALLILDESCAGLDPVARAEFLALEFDTCRLLAPAAVALQECHDLGTCLHAGAGQRAGVQEQRVRGRRRFRRAVGEHVLVPEAGGALDQEPL